MPTGVRKIPLNKTCSMCSDSYFAMNWRSKYCKKCKKIANAQKFNKWYLKNKEYFDKYYKKNRERLNKSATKYIKEHMWIRTYTSAMQRCNNPNQDSYKKYGGRGINCRMSVSDFKYLWDRDNANLLERPSIDRINSNGDYTLENCRYIELSENSRRKRGTKYMTQNRI
jgi:hypothetical protein